MWCEPFAHGVEYRRGRHEVHVGDARGEQVFAVFTDHHRVRLEGGHLAPVNFGIEQVNQIGL